MLYKALLTVLNNKTGASLAQLSHIQITIFILKRHITKRKIVSRLYVHGIWAYKFNCWNLSLSHSSRYNTSQPRRHFV